MIKLDAVRLDLERKLNVQLHETETNKFTVKHLEVMYKRGRKETLYLQGRFDEIRTKFDKMFEEMKGKDQK